jgi:Lrp/AsnC family transcriptional regulator for asnA, asnC and gidA
VQLDDINKAILSHLKDGRLSFKKIADILSITENTVRSRVKKLQESGILDISGYVDPESMAGHQIAYMGIKLNTMEMTAKGEEISRLKRVISVGVVTGRYDLIVCVHLKSGFGLLEFINEELTSIDDIQSVETFVVYKGFNLKVPYIV